MSTMRVRPLNLQAALRTPAPRWDWVFYVNGGLLVLFFSVFGSRFVLAPALNLRPPDVAAGSVAYTPSTAVVSIKGNGQIFTPEAGRVSYDQLRLWLGQKAVQSPDASLILVADASVSYADLGRIYEAAAAAGFKTVSLAAEPVRQ